MRMSKHSNHLHKYKKVDLARKKGKEKFLVYKCQVPTCSHYIPLSLAEGRVCECNRCGGVMLITKTTLQRSNGGAMSLPHCDDCIKRKNEETILDVASFLGQKKT